MSGTEPRTKAGVLGWPAGHSLSPRLHGFWLDHYGIDGTYEAIEVAPADFERTLTELAADGFAGVNITVPHKEAAARAATTLDEFARRVGAVNTIVFEDGGGISGSNTDGFGFTENLDAGAPGWRDAVAGVVLGAGGAARAIVAALLDAGIETVRLGNRTESKARALAAEIGGAIDVIPWADRSKAFVGAGLVVNTTTLGMTGSAPLDIDLTALPTTAVVTDIVYSPLKTPLLAAAAKRGNVTVDGLGMLLHQARPGFARWFGTAPEVSDALRRHVLAGLAA